MNAILLFGILLEIFEKGIDGIYLSETFKFKYKYVYSHNI